MGRAAFVLAVLAVACEGKVPEPTDKAGTRTDTAAPALPRPKPGTWRAVLESPGGELPFTLQLDGGPDTFTAVALNGPERIAFDSAKIEAGRLKLTIDAYESVIHAMVDGKGQLLSGEWSKPIRDGTARLPFYAEHGNETRFPPGGEGPGGPKDISGSWAVVFTNKDGTTFPGRAEFELADPRRLHGTFLTETGDYRYLEGDYQNGRLRLSCFDGGHAFLLVAAAVPGKDELRGDFWNRDRYHATWTANKLRAGEPDKLANPDEIAQLTAKDGRFRFSFPDLDGNTVSDADARFKGKVVVVDLFGTWCPNCNDQAPLLKQWHARYADRGLELVGLAFELSGDAAHDRKVVRRYRDRHKLAFPLLLAGISDKKKAGEALPSLDKVAAYPTTIFIDRKGKVRRVHSGFAGPATGDHHTKMVADLEKTIEELVGGQ